jgi:hypothetical protein
MAQQGDRYVVELKEPHLQWGEYRYTDTRETVKDEGYIPIPLNDARRLELVNSNATGGKDILGKNLFRYTTCDGYCKGFLKAQGRFSVRETVFTTRGSASNRSMV